MGWKGICSKTKLQMTAFGAILLLVSCAGPTQTRVTKPPEEATHQKRASETQKANTDEAQPMVVEKEGSGLEGKIFYKEDFSEVEEGIIPKGWLGGEKLIVKKEGRQKFLTSFEGLPAGTKHSFSVDNIKFPENFRFEWTINQLSGCDHYLDIGELHILVGMCYRLPPRALYKINDSRKEIEGNRMGETVKISIEKRGVVFRLFVDGNEILIYRISNFSSPSSFSFKNQTQFRLYEITGTDLGK